jgi:hypothetical protein
MKTMKIPGFTADKSLYKTNGHYQTSRTMINLPLQMIGTFGPALGISDEGPIEVHACRPGLVQIGEGANMICVDPTDPFGTRGHEGGGTDDGSGVPTDTGSGSGGTPSTPSNTCTAEQIQSKAAGPCIQKMQEDLNKGLRFNHYLRCSKNQKGKPIMACCQDYLDKQNRPHRLCVPIKTA